MDNIQFETASALVAKHEELKQQESELRAAIKAFVQDKNIPLVTRWDLFLATNVGNEEPFIVDFDSFDPEDYGWSWPYDFNVERYQVVETDSLVDELLDLRIDDDRITITMITSFQEEILQRFIKSFIFDW